MIGLRGTDADTRLEVMPQAQNAIIDRVFASVHAGQAHVSTIQLPIEPLNGSLGQDSFIPRLGIKYADAKTPEDFERARKAVLSEVYRSVKHGKEFNEKRHLLPPVTEQQLGKLYRSESIQQLQVRFPEELQSLQTCARQHNHAVKSKDSRYIRDPKTGEYIRDRSKDSRYIRDPGTGEYLREKSKDLRYIRDPQTGKHIRDKSKDSRYILDPETGEYIRDKAKDPCYIFNLETGLYVYDKSKHPYYFLNSETGLYVLDKSKHPRYTFDSEIGKYVSNKPTRTRIRPSLHKQQIVLDKIARDFLESKPPGDYN